MGNIFAGFCCAVLLMSTGEVAPVPLAANHHPWGQYTPGSWCIVQTTTVSNVEGRVVQSSQTLKITLQLIDESGITLQELETIAVSGKIVEKQPRIVKYDFFQEPIQENVHVNQMLPVKQKIGKNVIPCAIRTYEHRTAGVHLTTTVLYTPHVYPYIIRVEKTLRSSLNNEDTDGQIVRQSVTLVMETSALKTFRSSRKNRTYTLQTVEKVGNIRLVRKLYKILPILPKMSFSDKMGKFFVSFRTSLLLKLRTLVARGTYRAACWNRLPKKLMLKIGKSAALFRVRLTILQTIRRKSTAIRLPPLPSKW